MSKPLVISTDFPYESKFVDVRGAKMHYIEQGEGPTILFLHGIPTSSYLWRNVIPEVAPYGRCIALDLIGLGKSDKPDIDYRVFDHIDYVTDFIDALGLKDITLVMQGWGSVIGFSYARAHEKNIKALAFIEGQIRPPVHWNMLPFRIELINALLSQPDAKDKIMNTDYYIDQVMREGIMRPLSEEELSFYKQPFQNAESRKPIWQFLKDLPKNHTDKNTPGESDDVLQLITDYSTWLQKTSIPKLMLYGTPGFDTPILDVVQWAAEHLPHLKQVYLGEILHYPQEFIPQVLGACIGSWSYQQR